FGFLAVDFLLELFFYSPFTFTIIQIMLPFCCHKGHKSSKMPLFTGFFTGVKSFPLAPEN
ncbi:MAG: hypothetical protein ACI4GC_06120, partial [Acutalibacteraceae bacterium]